MENLDQTLDTLIELDGSVMEQECDYWVKIEAKRVDPTPFIPHGVRYSLTLHDKHGTRVLGYDNAHAVKPSGKFKFAGQRLPYDHKHRTSRDKGVPYTFQSAGALMTDFFSEVDRVITTAKSGG